MEEVRKIVREVLMESVSDLYYHGSCKDFDKFDNIGFNKSTTVFGNKLTVQGNFITKNIDFAKIFAKPGCFIYTVELLTKNIFDLRNEEHLKMYLEYIQTLGLNYEEQKEEEYIVDGLPVWDNYPSIEIAKYKGFDGIKLQEFSADISSYAIESIMVFEPSLVKVVGKEKSQ